MSLPSPCPSFLNGSTRNPNYLRANTFRFPTTDFGNDKIIKRITPLSMREKLSITSLKEWVSYPRGK